MTGDWIATDLDGTLFSRDWKEDNAVPGTWRLCNETKKRLPSSWIRSDTHRLMLALAKSVTIVPVTARDSDSFSHVYIEGLNLSSPAIIANGAIILDSDGVTDREWEKRVIEMLMPYQKRMDILLEAIRKIAPRTVRPRSVIGPLQMTAYLVVKTSDAWAAGTEGADLISALRQTDLAGFKLSVIGKELQLLPEGLGKHPAMKYIQATYFSGTSPLICMGDMLADIDFMRTGVFLATPLNSQIDRSWHNE